MAEDGSKPSLQALMDAVQELWRRFYPPALAVLTLVAITSILIGQFESIVRGITLQGVVSDSALRRLDSLGLKPLLPALALALILLGLQVVREVVQSLGGLLPPFIVVRSENLFQAFLGEDEMAKAWSGYDQAQDLDELDVIIDRELETPEVSRGSALHTQIAEYRASMLTFAWWLMYCKLCFYALPIIAGLGITRSGSSGLVVTSKALLLEALAVVVYCFIASRFLHAVQQCTASRIICWDASRPKMAGPPDPERLHRRQAQLTETSHGRWWGIAIRNPIRTSRASVLLGERLRRRELRDLRGGQTV